jgi:hypothetical protein
MSKNLITVFGGRSAPASASAMRAATPSKTTFVGDTGNIEQADERQIVSTFLANAKPSQDRKALCDMSAGYARRGYKYLAARLAAATTGNGVAVMAEALEAARGVTAGRPLFAVSPALTVPANADAASVVANILAFGSIEANRALAEWAMAQTRLPVAGAPSLGAVAGERAKLASYGVYARATNVAKALEEVRAGKPVTCENFQPAVTGGLA